MSKLDNLIDLLRVIDRLDDVSLAQVELRIAIRRETGQTKQEVVD